MACVLGGTAKEEEEKAVTGVFGRGRGIASMLPVTSLHLFHPIRHSTESFGSEGVGPSFTKLSDNLARLTDSTTHE